MSNVRPLPIDKVIKQKKKITKDKDKVAKPKVPKEPIYIRAYPHSAQLSNWGKIETVLDLFQSYTKLAQNIRNHQLYLFFTIGKLDRDATPPVINDKGSLLSLRYQQTCQYQVVGMLNSWIALRQNDFRRIVHPLPLQVVAQGHALRASRSCGLATPNLLLIRR